MTYYNHIFNMARVNLFNMLQAKRPDLPGGVHNRTNLPIQLHNLLGLRVSPCFPEAVMVFSHPVLDILAGVPKVRDEAPGLVWDCLLALILWPGPKPAIPQLLAPC